MRMLLLSVCLLAALMSFACPTFGQAVPSPLSKPMGPVSLSGKSVAEVAAQVASQTGLLLCVESLDPREDLVFASVRTTVMRTEIELHLPAEASAAAALDAAVAQDTRYEWSATPQSLHLKARAQTKDCPLDTPFSGFIPVDGPVTAQVRQLFGGHLPEGWTLTVVSVFGRAKGREVFALPSTVTYRDALDAVLWRWGAAGWMTKPVLDKDSRPIGTTLVILS